MRVEPDFPGSLRTSRLKTWSPVFSFDCSSLALEEVLDNIDIMCQLSPPSGRSLDSKHTLQASELLLRPDEPMTVCAYLEHSLRNIEEVQPGGLKLVDYPIYLSNFDNY
jgi:hypothetical protein